MKRCFALLALTGLLLSRSAVAQIPNAGFETWIADSCVGWSGVNFQQTTDAHSGSYAVMGQVELKFFFLAPDFYTASTNATNPKGFPCTDRPGSFNGFYTFSPAAASNDSLVCLAFFSKANVIIGTALFVTDQNAPAYTQFTAPITWYAGDSPDSAVCDIRIRNATEVLGTPGTGFKIDDLSFSGSSAVAPNIAPAFSLSESSQNPVFSSSKIEYSLASDGPATLTLYDVTGRQIAVLATGYHSAGTHVARFDGSALPAGMYFYRLTTADASIERSLQVIK